MGRPTICRTEPGQWGVDGRGSKGGESGKKQRNLPVWQGDLPCHVKMWVGVGNSERRGNGKTDGRLQRRAGHNIRSRSGILDVLLHKSAVKYWRGIGSGGFGDIHWVNRLRGGVRTYVTTMDNTRNGGNKRGGRKQGWWPGDQLEPRGSSKRATTLKGSRKGEKKQTCLNLSSLKKKDLPFETSGC